MTHLTAESDLPTVRNVLEQAGQAHVLQFVEKLDSTARARLLGQIASVDWQEVARLVETHVRQKTEVALPDHLEPAPWYPHTPEPAQAAKYAQAQRLGEHLITSGKVAAFTVAGGQGTRLGWDAPKGTYPATPIRGISLFECFAEYIHKVQAKYRTLIPWYIMTSPINHHATVAFFEENGWFGLDQGQVMHFPQQMMPAIDATSGKVILEARDSIAMSPNGHGGSLKALYESGAVGDMQARGIEQISYTQVDNPIVRVIDPLFIGLHALDGAQMSSKMLPKAYPKEKLGNFCLVDDRIHVIEYSDLPDELAEQRLENGQLRFRAGSIAIHAIRVDFVAELNRAEGFGLPFHRADKKVPYYDAATDSVVTPTEPNAVKLETFVFDALPLCETSIIYEASREDEFAPIKNADAPGAVDCPATSKAMQIDRAARWLEASEVEVARDASGKAQAVLEITQRTAIAPEDLAHLDLPTKIAPGESLLL